jgi:hypothetical protein
MAIGSVYGMKRPGDMAGKVFLAIVGVVTTITRLRQGGPAKFGEMGARNAGVGECNRPM